jgi:(p)ppGpp synthase/HD superfamily hydrolase
MEILAAAIALAHECHKNQRYGDQPYTYHLLHTATVLAHFGFNDEQLLAAAWLHDSMEDAGVTRQQIAEACGDYVGLLVWQVTDEPGSDRKERKKATYKKTAASPDAIAIKLADRIANVQQSKRDNPRLLKMYKKEQPGFSAALRPHGIGLGAMWSYLDGLLEI